MEKEDYPLLFEWFNDPQFEGEFEPLDPQRSKKEFEDRLEKFGPDEKVFLIEKKNGSKIGSIGHYHTGSMLEIGYSIVPDERGKGYCTEAVQIIVDYLFLSRNIVRVQAHTNVRNRASQRVLEKSGFKKEGTFRKEYFVRGEWVDSCVYGILREEWKEPKILTKTT
jgi:RimJ/RimL family protein N-acetyltransferase